jgi:hypothetical protein
MVQNHTFAIIGLVLTQIAMIFTIVGFIGDVPWSRRIGPEVGFHRKEYRKNFSIGIFTCKE